MRIEPEHASEGNRHLSVPITTALSIGLFGGGAVTLLVGLFVLGISCWERADCLERVYRETIIAVAFIAFASIAMVSSIVLGVRAFQQWRTTRSTTADA